MRSDRYYLEMAMSEAEQASRDGTFPIGAVIVGAEDQVLSSGRNRVYSQDDYTCHAEIDAIRQAGRLLMAKPHFKAAVLYTTAEPCLMCAGAIVMANISRVVWVMDDDYYGAMRHQHSGPRYPEHFTHIAITRTPERDLEARMHELMAEWALRQGHHNSPWLHNHVNKTE